MIVLADANARVGSEVSQCIGPFGAEPENIAGECFHAWLHEHSLFVPQTDDAFHHGCHTTWQHSSGGEARLDYIAIDQALRNSAIKTCLADVDLTIQKPDHMPIVIDLPITCNLRAPRSADAAHKKLDPVGLEPPSVPWHVNVHSHAGRLQHWLQQHQPAQNGQYRRKRHLQDSTWTLIARKKWHWRRCRHLRQTYRRAMLRELFTAWRYGTSPDDVRCYRPWLRVCDQALALHGWQYSRLCSQVLHAVRQDDRHYYEQIACHQDAVAADEGLSGLWRHIKHILPKGIAKRKSNLRCFGPQVDELCQHYCNLEAGYPVPYTELLDQCAARQRAAQDELPLTLRLSDIPTRTEIESLCKLAKRGRAPGLDGVQAEVLQQCMVANSEVFFAMLFKIWTLAAEPLSFKGGSICSIAKKTGVTSAAGMRGVMLLDTLAKLYHALLRHRLLPWATNHRTATQFGGYKGQQTIFATLMLRCFANYVSSQCMSMAIIFVDVRSAFHCLLRQHAFGTSENLPSALVDALVREGLDIEHILQQIPLIAADFRDAPSAVARVMRDAHQDTWFTCPGSQQCFATTRGSRPGSPIADLAYNVMMSSLLRQLQARIDGISTLQEASAILQCQAPLLAWVDDVALPLPCRHAGQVDPLLQQVLTMMHEVFASYGLRLNCSAGKTEAIVHYRGKQAPALRKERFLDGYGKLSVPGYEELRIVAQYTHLGIVVAQNFDLSADLNFKLGKATSAFRSMSRTIFHNRRWSIELRLKLFDTLILPIIFYGSGSWPLLSARQFLRLSGAITKWQRQIVGIGFWSNHNVTDAEFRATWRIPDLSIRLAKHRLLFMLQLHRHAPSEVWHMITAEDEHCKTSWLQAVRHAFKWLHTMHQDVPTHECTAADLLTWVQMATHQKARLIRNAVARHLTQEQTAHHVVSMHRSIQQTCIDAGVDFDTVFAPSPVGGIFAGDNCPCTFSSIQGLNAHRWKKHGVFSSERKFVFSGVCECCRKCFWTA